MRQEEVKSSCPGTPQGLRENLLGKPAQARRLGRGEPARRLRRLRLPGSPQEAPTDIQRLRERQRPDQEAHPRCRPLPE